MRNDVEFTTDDGTVLRGWHYPSEKAGENEAPIVVMAHGFSGVKGSLTKYADVFSEAGLNVLVYDHRGFGDSEGTTRQEIDPHVQISDFRDAITFAQQLPGVDPARLGVWGSSLAGGHCIILGATDERVRCVSIQVPAISGKDTVRRLFRADRQKELRKLHAEDRIARMNGSEPSRIRVFSTEDEVCALPPPVSRRFIEASEGEDPLWKNEVTLRSLENLSAYEPGAYIDRVSPTPILIVVGLKDTVAPADFALAAYERAREPKKLVLHQGGHFATYYQFFEQTSGEARDWFLAHL